MVMRLLTSLLFGVILTATAAADSFAQEAPVYFAGDRQFYGGVVIGLNCSQVDGDTYSGFHSAGLNAGGLVYWHFHPQIGMSLEFLYSQKGSKGVTESTDPYAGPYFEKYKIRLNYVEAPLVFHYFLSPRFQVGLGGSFNALIGSKESLTMIYPVNNLDAGPFNKYTFDLVGSLSVAVWKGIMLNARYQYGITPLRDWQNAPVLSPAAGRRDEYNNMVTFRIIYLF